MITINERNFDQMTNQGKAIVDFYGNFCINCKLLEPVLNDLAKDYPDINFYQVDVDASPNLVKRFGVTALPTIVFIKNGQALPPFVGLKPKNFLRRNIDDLLN